MENINDLKIGIFMGGNSLEREISLITGENVLKALKKRGLNVVGIDLRTESKHEIKNIITQYKIDLVFIAMHGRFGEDGTLQSILEDLGVPYTGSDSRASKNAMDKTLTRKLQILHNIPHPKFKVVKKKDEIDLESLLKEFKNGKIVIKPANQGSSIGLHIIKKEKSELNKALKEAFKIDETLLIEEFIEGAELTVGILEERVLPPIRIIPKEVCFDFKCKYTQGFTFYEVPAKIPKELEEKVKDLALKTHRALGLRDFSRIDMRISLEGEPFVLEANSIPGLTPTSLLPKAAKLVGFDFESLCIKMIELALKRCTKKERSL